MYKVKYFEITWDKIHENKSNLSIENANYDILLQIVLKCVAN